MRILQYPEDANLLRQPTSPVTKEMLSDPSFLRKLAELKDLSKQDGIGLAFSQTGISLNLFLILIDRSLTSIEPEVIINPKLLSESITTEKHNEGCLSFKDLELNINRPTEITWEYENLNGEKFTTTDKGFYCRVICHELDHCNGTLFIDRASVAERLRYERWLKSKLRRK